MSDLVERARLTKDENQSVLRRLFGTTKEWEVSAHYELDAIANAQLAKALWVVVDWLEGEDVQDELIEHLDDAGLERP